MTIFASTYLMPPVSLVVLLSIAVLWLARHSDRRRARRVRHLCVFLAVVSLLATLPVVPKTLSWPLKSLVADWDERGRPPVGAIVVPTAGSYVDANGRRWATRQTLQRVTSGLVLAEETGLPLAISGGSPEEEPLSEAALAVEFLGIDPDTLLLDTKARNTHENALAFARMLEPLGTRNVVVVTDSIHMARMAASLSAAGYKAYGYRLGLHVDAALKLTDFVPSNRGIGYMSKVASGYAGNLYYLLRGRFSLGDLLGTAQNGASVPATD